MRVDSSTHSLIHTHTSHNIINTLRPPPLPPLLTYFIHVLNYSTLFIFLLNLNKRNGSRHLASIFASYSTCYIHKELHLSHISLRHSSILHYFIISPKVSVLGTLASTPTLYRAFQGHKILLYIFRLKYPSIQLLFAST